MTVARNPGWPGFPGPVTISCGHDPLRPGSDPIRLPAPDEPAHRNALWHNRLFNTQLPDAVRILGFRPDWTAAASLRAEAG